MNMRIKLAVGMVLASMLVLAAGLVKAEIYSATLDGLSGAAAALNSAGGDDLAGAETRLGGLYSGLASAPGAAVVYAAVPSRAPATRVEAKALKFAAYAKLEEAAAVEKAGDAKGEKEPAAEAWKPAPIPDTSEAVSEDSAISDGAFYGWLAIFALVLLILL